MMDRLALMNTAPHLPLNDVQRIVVVRALHLGDFLCSVPALRALKERFPQAELTYIGLPWAKEVVRRYHYIDRFLEFPGYRGLEGTLSDPVATSQFFIEARSYRYDLAIQMHGDGRISNSFTARLGARFSLGYRILGSRQPRQLDLELAFMSNVHEIFRWLRLVGFLGAQGSPQLEFPLVAEDEVEMETVAYSFGIDLEKPIVMLHSGAKESAKRWPPEAFSEAGDRLAEQLGAQIAITGSHDEIPLGRAVAERMRNRAHLLSGRTSLGGLAALLSRATLLITNDSGPSHLAAALGIPSVVLFGPTKPAIWAPLDRSIHKALWSGQDKPITSISVDRVVEESFRLVKECACLTS
ncbi:MAG: glycosyltransferase family 9 protein [Chloroflexota bacterium]|jgi:ADP-heptose:LPS heptosyltransferase